MDHDDATPTSSATSSALPDADSSALDSAAESPGDEILAQLATLSIPELDHQTSERIRRRARVTFDRYSKDRDEHPVLALLSRFYWRVEPAMVGAVAVVYLVWAFRTVSALLQ